MSWRCEPGRFALVGFAGPPDAADLAQLAPPAQLIHEVDETTMLVREEQLAALLARRPAARVERELVWIRFDAPMAWDVVGFLARVTGALAAAGVPLGAVCGYSRDHLFVAERWLAPATRALGRLLPRGTGDPA